MEWNGECAQLQLTCVTGTVQSIVSLGLLSRVYETSWHCPCAFISKHGTVASSSSGSGLAKSELWNVIVDNCDMVEISL